MIAFLGLCRTIKQKREAVMSNVNVYQMVSVAHHHVWCVEGVDAAFHPGRFVAPDLFLAVNPYTNDTTRVPHIDDFRSGPFSEATAQFFVVSASFCDLQHALFKQAKLDAEDHYECESGGLYALWKMNERDVLVAGMDIGGGDTAQNAAYDVSHAFGGRQVFAGHLGSSLPPVLQDSAHQIEENRSDRVAEAPSDFPKPHKI